MFQSLKEIELFFDKRRKVGIKPGLERINTLLKKLQHPEKSLRAIHVAGTNGKGSTIEFLNKALIANDYTVGVFSSPSFTNICGHFFINDEQMKRAELIAIMNELLPLIKKMDEGKMYLSEFEIITVIAIVYFKTRTDIALIETGMGGMHDTTNCLNPLLSIITNVHIDHTAFLGPSLEEITRHKAGIIKQDTPVIIGKVTNESKTIINEVANRNNAIVHQLFTNFTYIKTTENSYLWKADEYTPIPFTLHLKGNHQLENASLALMALMLLRKQGFYIDTKRINHALFAARLPGRFEKIWEKPTVIIDSAHNMAGVKAFRETAMVLYPESTTKVLFAGFKDKQLKQMVHYIYEEIPDITITTFEHDRAATLEDLKELGLPPEMNFIADWQDYLLEFIYKPSDVIYFITGSLQFITLIRHYLLIRKN